MRKNKIYCVHFVPYSKPIIELVLSGSCQCSGSGALGHWLHCGLWLGSGDCQVFLFGIIIVKQASIDFLTNNICRTLGKVKTTGIEKGTLAAFEDFLCALIRGSYDVTDVLKDNGVISVCQVNRGRVNKKGFISNVAATSVEGSLNCHRPVRCRQAEEA